MHILPPTLAKARARLVVHAPFYGSMALGLRWQEDATLPTMATDGRAIFYNRAWCDEIGSDKCMGVIAHEVLHVVNKHHLRRGERDPKLWNIAADLVINTILQGAGYALPEGGVFDTQGEFAGLWVETVYARLETRAGRRQDGSGSPSLGTRRQRSRCGLRAGSDAVHDSRSCVCLRRPAGRGRCSRGRRRFPGSGLGRSARSSRRVRARTLHAGTRAS